MAADRWPTTIWDAGDCALVLIDYQLLRTLEERREQQNQTQTAVAAAMATSQSFVARLESTAADAKVSTVERYAGSLGDVVQSHLVPLDQSADEPTVIVHESSSVAKGVRPVIRSGASGDDDRPWGSWCASGDAATSGVAPEAMLGGGCATLAASDSEGNQRARPSSERPLPAKAA